MTMTDTAWAVPRGANRHSENATAGDKLNHTERPMDKTFPGRGCRESISRQIPSSPRGGRYHCPPPALWSSLHTVRHSLFALLLAALPLTAEAQNRTPPSTATMSHSATSISMQPPAGPSPPFYFLSHKVSVYPHPGSTIFDDTDYARTSGNCTNVPSAVLIGVHGMFGNGHLNGGAIRVPMRTCGSHTVGETFRMSWSGDSSKAWRSCRQTEYGQSCGYSRSGNGTPARAYFAFGPGSNCTVESVVTTEMGTVRGATSCWTTVTIQ